MRKAKPSSILRAGRIEGKSSGFAFTRQVRRSMGKGKGSALSTFPMKAKAYIWDNILGLARTIPVDSAAPYANNGDALGKALH